MRSVAVQSDGDAVASTRDVFVVVDPRTEVPRQIADAAAAVGSEVIACSTARRGLNTTCALEPSCVVTAALLSDHDARWLVAALRGQPSDVASVPVVVLAEGGPLERRELLASGCDLVLPSSIGPKDLIAQLQALVALSWRIRERAAISSARPEPSAPASRPLVLSGSLERTAVATVLAVLELERYSGILSLSRASPGKRRMFVAVAAGVIVGGRVDADELKPLEAVDAALHWGPGRFDFTPGKVERAGQSSVSLARLLIASMGRRGEESPKDAPTLARPEVSSSLRRPMPGASTAQGPPEGSPGPVRSLDPPRRSTLLSQPAQRGGAQPARRRMSSQLRAAIQVTAAPASRADLRQPPDPRAEPDDDDVIEAENEPSTRKPR